MDVSALVLYYDPVSVYMDDRIWICRCGTSGMRSLIRSSVMGYHSKRSRYASGILILVLCGRARQNYIAKMDGSRKCTCILLHSLCHKSNTSGYSIPPWIHKRLDERKHDLFLYPHMDCRKQKESELIIKKKDTVMWSLSAFVNDIERKPQHVITKAKRDTSLYPSLYKNYFCVIRISPLVVVTPHSYSELFAPCGISILPLCVFAEKL